jgi:hypothetical protein
MHRMRDLLFLLAALVAFGCPEHKSPDSYMQKASGHPERVKAVWKSVAPGIWMSDIGTPGSVNLLDMAGITPRMDALTSKGAVEFPLNTADISSVVRDGKTYLRFPLDETEQIYGLGLHFQSVHQRGKIFRLHVDHYGDQDNGRTHAPVPFYISSKGYGVLINAAQYIDIWVGTAVRKESPHAPKARDRTTDPEWSAQPASDVVEILIPADGVSVYVFGGLLLMSYSATTSSVEAAPCHQNGGWVSGSECPQHSRTVTSGRKWRHSHHMTSLWT